MPSHAAFLRGINVGGHAASKAQLCEAFESLGFGEVSTFRASGNVIFDCPRGSPEAGPIQRRLEEVLGYAAPVFIRTARQVAAIAGFEPFGERQRAASGGKLQVTFLPSRPSKAKAARALALATPADPLAFRGAELYWLPKGRMSESELDLKALERVLGPGTTRTMGTVELIAARM